MSDKFNGTSFIICAQSLKMNMGNEILSFDIDRSPTGISIDFINKIKICQN